MSTSPSTTNCNPGRVLSIQSHVVSGYVGNKCAVFPLQVLGFDVDFINSVQFSNHTGYGRWKGQVLNENDLDDLFVGLQENNLVDYTQVLTGYVGSESFLRKICFVVSEIKKNNPGAIYLCDPVLGDNKEFYVPESLIPIYQKEVLPLADITTPNTFELELLSGMAIKTEADALVAMSIVHDIGVPIVVLTSLDSDGPDLVTYVSSRFPDSKCSVWKLVSTQQAGRFTGTGDLFSALFLGLYSRHGNSVSEALEKTSAILEVILQRTLEKSSGPLLELQLVQSLDVILNPVVVRRAIGIPLS